MNTINELDNEFSMTQNRLWLFPDVIADDEIVGFFTGYEKITENAEGHPLKKPMLVLNVDFERELKNTDFAYKEFRVSFWTLSAKARDMKPSELIKTTAFKFKREGNKIGIEQLSDKPYIETIDVEINKDDSK